jgi:hypothetical protein
MNPMGLFDWLFGGGSKPEPAPDKQPEPTKVIVADIHPETVSVEAVNDAINPEIVAAIAASINCVMGTGVRNELLKAITATVVHRDNGEQAARMKPARNAWALAGIQRLMDSRQSV